MRFAPITLALLSAATFIIAAPGRTKEKLDRAEEALETMQDCDHDDPDALLRHSEEAGRQAVLAAGLRALTPTIAKKHEQKHLPRIERMQSTAERQRDYHTELVEDMQLLSIPHYVAPDLTNPSDPHEISWQHTMAEELHNQSMAERARADQAYEEASQMRHVPDAGSAIRKGAVHAARSRRYEENARSYTEKANAGQAGRVSSRSPSPGSRARAGQAAQTAPIPNTQLGQASQAGNKRKSPGWEGHAGPVTDKKMRLDFNSRP